MGIFIPAPQGFGFLPTVQSHGWWELQPFSWDREHRVLTIGLRLPKNRIAAVRVRDAGSGRGVDMETESDLTPSQRESAVWMVRSVFRLDEDLSHFYRLCWRQEKYRDLVAAGAGRILRAPTLFENLVKAICAANVQWKQAVLCINRLAAVGDPIPGTGLHLFPSAEQILSAGEQFLRDTVRIGYRTQSVLELAERSMETGFQGDLVEQGRLRGEDLRKFFLSIRGIGPVMAHSLLTLYGEYAYLPIDSSVIEMVQANHMNGVKPTRKQVKEIYHPYGKYQALILWYELARHFGWY